MARRPKKSTGWISLLNSKKQQMEFVVKHLVPNNKPGRVLLEKFVNSGPTKIVPEVVDYILKKDRGYILTLALVRRGFVAVERYEEIYLKKSGRLLKHYEIYHLIQAFLQDVKDPWSGRYLRCGFQKTPSDLLHKIYEDLNLNADILSHMHDWALEALFKHPNVDHLLCFKATASPILTVDRRQQAAIRMGQFIKNTNADVKSYYPDHL